jgi:hypothetical protein
LSKTPGVISMGSVAICHTDKIATFAVRRQGLAARCANM